MIGGFQFESGAKGWFLDVGEHLYVHRVGIFIYRTAQPRKHRRQLRAVRIVDSGEEFFEISWLNDPHTPQLNVSVVPIIGK